MTRTSLAQGRSATGALFWMIATGRLVTRREADGITHRAEKAERAIDSLIAQNAELMEMARLGQATFSALRQAVEDTSP